MDGKEQKTKPAGYVFGRPTKYKPKYCDMLIEHMANGGSFEGFAAVVKTHSDTLYDWLDAQPDFLEAKKAGFIASRKFWEDTMADQARGKINGSSTALIFALKNRFPKDYRDRTEQKVQAYVGDIENDPERLSPEQLEEIAKVMRSKN